MTKTATTIPEEITLTPEDVALLADGTGDVPDETAVRLQALILCDDPRRIAATWRAIAGQLEELRRMAEDAGVELLADGLYAYRCLERLRSLPWERPADVLDLRLDVPLRELLSMTGAMIARADGAEKAELKRLFERLAAAQGEETRDDDLFEGLIERLLDVGPEAAEATLTQLEGRYRQRRQPARNKR
jgi:hypothetical protein